MKFFSIFDKDKAVFVSVFFFVLITFQDIIINQYYWYSFHINYAPTNRMYFDPNSFITVYVLFLFVIFIPSLTFILTILTDDYRTIPLIALLCYGGSEDVLWFWLQGRSVPDNLPWLWGGVTSHFLYVVASITFTLFLFVAKFRTIPVFPMKYRYAVLEVKV